MTQTEIEEYITQFPIYQYAFVKPEDIEFNDRVRQICKKECSRYGASWSCPPAVGTVEVCKMCIRDSYTCAYSYAYRSIMGNGTITEVTDPEAKKKGLGKIMAHIAPEAKIAFLPEMVERVAVWLSLIHI